MTTETKFTVGEYKTRDGRRARVYATDGGGDEPIHGAILDDGSGVWFPNSWDDSGSWAGRIKKENADLMPPLRECWRIDGSSISYSTREEAEERVKDLLADGAPGPITITKYREVSDDQA